MSDVPNPDNDLGSDKIQLYPEPLKSESLLQTVNPVQHVTIDLTFGNRTCASAPGKFCSMLGQNGVWGRNPLQYVCTLYPEDLLPELDIGWLGRGTSCLKRWPPKQQ
jgi:hypothetical protein